MKFIKNLFGTSDEVSSKRFVGVVSFLVIVVTAFVDLFTDHVMSPYIFDGLMYIVLGCFFFNVLETYSKRTPSSTVKVDKVANMDVQVDNNNVAQPLVDIPDAPEGDPAFDPNNTVDELIPAKNDNKRSTTGSKR